jgi:hypothetical protein
MFEFCFGEFVMVPERAKCVPLSVKPRLDRSQSALI